MDHCITFGKYFIIWLFTKNVLDICTSRLMGFNSTVNKNISESHSDFDLDRIAQINQAFILRGLVNCTGLAGGF